MNLIRLFVVVSALVLYGCPSDEGESCRKVMQCEEDVEMLCDKTDAGCGESCHYFVHEHCYEVCQDAGMGGGDAQ